MLIHLPIIILTSFHPIAIADAAPKFDIARERQVEGGSTEMQKRCVDDETQARNQLQANGYNLAPTQKPSAAPKPARTALPAMSNS